MPSVKRHNPQCRQARQYCAAVLFRHVGNPIWTLGCLQAQEEEEDSALLVNYGSSMCTGRTQASLHGRVSHAPQSGAFSSNVLAASRDLRAASGPVHSSHAQTSESALLFDIDDTQQPHGGMPLRTASEPAEEQVPSSGMLIDIADSPGPGQQQPRVAVQLDTAQRRSTQAQASDNAARCKSADGLASCAGGQSCRTAAGTAAVADTVQHRSAHAARSGAHGHSSKTAATAASGKGPARDSAQGLSLNAAPGPRVQRAHDGGNLLPPGLLFDIDDDDGGDDGHGSTVKAKSVAAHQSCSNPAAGATEAQHNPSFGFHFNEGNSHQLEHAVGQALLFDIDDDDDDDDDGNQAETVQSISEHQHQEAGAQKQPAKGLSCTPAAAANGLLFDIDDGDATGQRHSNNNDSVAAAKPSGHPQHANQSLSMPAAASLPAFDIGHENTDFRGGGAAAASSSRQRSDTDILACMAAPALVPSSNTDDGDKFQPSLSAAQLQARRVSHVQASTSAAAIATVPTRTSSSMLGQSQQPTPDAVAKATTSQNIAPALQQHQLQQQPQQKLQVLNKNRQSFKPPRRVSLTPAATDPAAKAARADAQAGEASGRPLKRLRKAGQSGASVSSATKPPSEDGE